ncbi:MAG TPA: hypothetical protein V6D18_11200 [Thermosynechococcaceae cyanobacterium]
MTKHFILNLDPAAKYEWDRCTLRDPITADHPALAGLVADAVGDQPGSYLVSVSIEVKVLEQAELDRSSYSLPVPVEVSPRSIALAERVA